MEREHLCEEFPEDDTPKEAKRQGRFSFILLFSLWGIVCFLAGIHAYVQFMERVSRPTTFHLSYGNDMPALPANPGQIVQEGDNVQLLPPDAEGKEREVAPDAGRWVPRR